MFFDEVLHLEEGDAEHGGHGHSGEGHVHQDGEAGKAQQADDDGDPELERVEAQYGRRQYALGESAVACQEQGADLHDEPGYACE